VAPDPTSPFGRQLLDVERVATEAAWAAGGAPVTMLRFAPVTGAAMASPLGRYLRLPVVAVSAFADPTFCLLHQTDAADAIVAAVAVAPDGPVNVVGPGAVTALQAARLGGRVPVPVAGPSWQLARVAAELLGAPIPAHLRELLERGRVADGGAVAELLHVEPKWSTIDVVRDVHEWADVTYYAPAAP
jgi:UDP-glucose 4-epimerase